MQLQRKKGRKKMNQIENGLINQFNHSNALGFVRIILTREGIVIHFHAQTCQQFVNCFHVRRMTMDTTRGIRHIHGRVPLDSGSGPVTSVNEQTITNIGQH